MNSLVVLFSLVALAAAKPSGLLHSEVLAYAAPTILPAAVSSQSRIDIKSSPEYVATAVEPIAHSVIAEPTIYAAPAAVSHQSRIDIKSSPAYITKEVEPIAHAVIAEPTVYAAPAIAPAAVSHQSRVDIKSSPAVVSSYISTPIATAAIAPTYIKEYAAPAIAPTYIKEYTEPAIAYAAPTLYKSVDYEEHPVAEDTPENIATRFAYFQAKAEAIRQTHSVHKRSAPLFTPAITTYSAPLVSPYAAAHVVHAAPITYSAPLTYHTPILTKAYSVHPY